MNGLIYPVWTGEELYAAWVDAPGSDLAAEWPRLNVFEQARWEKLAIRLSDDHAGGSSA